jgi:predicted porin
MEMIGGLKKTTSRLAIAAAAGLLAAAAGGYATQAVAADLGGNCCADLEERIAELEATTARKGNRKVSLTVYGQVNEYVLFWDDGEMDDVYQVTNDVSRTRFGFRGSAKIDSEWTAGYLVEIGIRTANSGAVSQFSDVSGALGATDRDSGDDLGGGTDLRHAYWYIQSQRLGTLTIGQTDTPSSSTFTLTLANIPMIEADPSGVGGAAFRIRTAAGPVSAVGSALFWQNLMHPNQGSLSRRNEVMYTSPTWSGFQFKAAWGEDDFWSASLAWAGEHSGFRLAAKVAYADVTDTSFAIGTTAGGGVSNNTGCTPGTAPVSDTDHREVDCNHWVFGASVMHVATGLFVSGGYVDFTDDNRAVGVDDNDTAWFIHGGIEQKWFALGKTTLYGEYGEQENGLALAGYGGETMSFWGLGAVQNIEAAAMDLYLFYRELSSELPTTTLDAQDFTMFGIGGIIRF